MCTQQRHAEGAPIDEELDVVRRILHFRKGAAYPRFGGANVNVDRPWLSGEFLPLCQHAC
jgi:hypothetical protein